MPPNQEASRPDATVLDIIYNRSATMLSCALDKWCLEHCTLAGVAGGYYLCGRPQGVLSGVATFAFRLGRAAS